ncbi:hypothetical protein PoHVEF18_010459 [Penicillium ochrochloron]
MASGYELEPWCVTDAPSHETEGLVPIVAHEELHPSFMMGNQEFPFAVQGDLDPWMADQLGWNAQGEYTKVAETQRYPQSWVEAGLTIHSAGGKWENLEDSSPVYDQQQLYADPLVHDVERQRWNSLMATQRALFMTPSVQPPNFPTFPGSPISDPCGTPETSHASFGRWETDQDGEDLQSSRSPDTPNTNTTMSDRLAYSHSSHHFEEEEYPTTLEMPDGSTRRTSNWLPVDASAGFTIGADQPGPAQGEHEMHNFREMQGAFIPADPIGWTYNQ